MQDLRFAARILARNPTFTVIAVITLALGIGANAAIFSVVNAALLRPLAFRDPQRLVVVWDQLLKLGLRQFPVSDANYIDYKNANRVFDDVAAFRSADFNLTTPDRAERVSGASITPNLLPMLGASAAIGRAFMPEDGVPGGSLVAVLSDGIWRRYFGGDRSAIGNKLTLDGGRFTVIGVMPPEFAFSSGASGAAELWIPLVLHPEAGRTSGALELIARLKLGTTVEQARANMNAVSADVEERHHPYRGPHGEDAGYGANVIALREQLYGGMRRGLFVLTAAVGFVLLIACANVSNLLLARSAERRKEIAIRKALGAPTGRLLRQSLAESATLSALGGCVGLALAFWGVDMLSALVPAGPPHVDNIGIDGRVLGFTLLISLATGLVFGITPALDFSTANMNEVLKENARSATGGRRSRFVGRALVIAEVALSVVLVIGAGLLIRSFTHLLGVNPGFQPEKLLTARISPSQAQYREGRRVSAFYEELLERLRRLPGVQAASAVSALPLTGGTGGDPFSIQGRPYDAAGKTPQVANQRVVASDYFRTMGIPLLAGRVFAEREPRPAVIINQTMARGFWPVRGPIGEKVVLGAPRPDAPWLEIVGVVADVRNSDARIEPLPQMYVLLDRAPEFSMSLVIRTTRDLEDIVPTLRAAVFAVDPNQPVYDIRTMEQRMSANVAQQRFQATLLGLFAGLALLLAAIGIYGVLAQSVGQRTREIGIRVPLGAEPRRVLRLVVREGMTLTAIGIGIGLAAALALGRTLSSLLYGVNASDPLTYAGASLLLWGIALIACYAPARRAARVDPLTALRSD